jgi:hypothetical protein
MPGPVPGIHAGRSTKSSKVFANRTAWMAGTSPAMTTRSCTKKPSHVASAFPFPRTTLPQTGEGIFRRLANILDAD